MEVLVCSLPTVRINVLLMLEVYNTDRRTATWLSVELPRKSCVAKVCICTGGTQVKKGALPGGEGSAPQDGADLRSLVGDAATACLACSRSRYAFKAGTGWSDL